MWVRMKRFDWLLKWSTWLHGLSTRWWSRFFLRVQWEGFSILHIQAFCGSYFSGDGPWLDFVGFVTRDYSVHEPGRRTSSLVNSFSITWNDRCSQFLIVLSVYHRFSRVFSGFFVWDSNSYLHRRAGSWWRFTEWYTDTQTLTLPFLVTSLICSCHDDPIAISFL